MGTRHLAIRDVMRDLRREKGVAQRHAEALMLPLLLRLLASSDKWMGGVLVAMVTAIIFELFLH